MKSLTAFMSAVGMVCCCFEFVSAQVSTVQSGNWSSPSTWSGGIVPDSTHGSITIAHPITLSDTTVTLDEVIVQSTLTIESTATVILSNAVGGSADLQIIENGQLDIFGKMICKDGSVLSGTSASNTFFRSGSTYEHRYITTAGEPPAALWDNHSTVAITGYRTSRSLNTTGWTQFFGNVEYNCANQEASAFVEMLGNLKNIQGNFHIRNTNGGVLRLTLDRTTLNTINIGGNFIIEGRSEVWFSREANTVINVGGDFEYRSTATASTYLTTMGTCEVNVNGNVVVNTPGILRFASNSGGTGTLRVKQNFMFSAGNLAVLPAGQGIIECNGNATQSVLCSGTISPEITFLTSNSAGVEFMNNSVVTGNVHVSTGGLLLPQTFTIQRNLIVDPGASIACKDCALLLTGGLDQTLSLQADTLHNIIVNKDGGSALLTSALYLSGSLAIHSQNTDFFSNGNLTLLSLSDEGDDALITSLPEGSEIIGDVTVQRFMQGEGRIYRYLSSPVSTATVASWQDDFPVTGTFENPSAGPGLNSNNPSCFWYDETMSGSLGWTAYPSSGLSENSVLVPGRGYAAFIRQALTPTVWDVTGAVNQGEVNMNVSFTDTGNLQDDGWNLVGNPYPSPIDWDNETGWQKINVDNEIAIRDNGSGTILYWDGAIGSLGHGRIATGQAFWVKANGDNPSLIIHETAKTTNTTEFFRKPADALDYLELTVQNEKHVDKTYLRLRSDASSGFDQTDVQKMDNDFINLSFVADALPVAIAATNVLTCDRPHPLLLNFSSATSRVGSYKFVCASYGLFTSVNIKLYDSFTEEFHDLNTPYSFTITTDSSSFASDRFSLSVETQNSLDAISFHHDSVFCDQQPYELRVEGISGDVRSNTFINQRNIKSQLLTDTANHILLDPSTLAGEALEIRIQISTVCDMKEERWTVNSFKDPIIMQDGEHLTSTYVTGNQWYFENEFFSDDQRITPKRTGLYSLKTTQGICSGSDQFHLLNLENNIAYFPNPVLDIVTFLFPADEHPAEIVFFDGFGRSVKNFRMNSSFENSFSIKELPAGIYFVRIQTTTRSYSVKLVKE